MLTDPVIINELRTAIQSKYNLKVHIYVDSVEQLDSRFRLDCLHKYTLSEYKRTEQELMHHKCMVFESQNIVVLGSANFTNDALGEQTTEDGTETSNYENLVVIHDQELVQFCKTNLIDHKISQERN